MLPIGIYNNILLREEERREIMGAINRERRIARNNSDPFFMTDEQFRRLFRLTKEMVNDILFPSLIPHLEKASRLAITSEHKILLCLNFFATGHYQNRLGLDWKFPTSQQTLSNIIKEVTPVIVRELGDEWVKFPSERPNINSIKAKFMERTHFPGILGAVDCTHIPIKAPIDQEHNYVNRKGYHSKNIQIICDYDLKILNLNARFGGAAHDAFIFRQSAICRELERRYLEGDTSTWLLGDSGYPQKPYLMTPIVNAPQVGPEANYTYIHIRARNCIERCIGVLKSVFRCMSGENKLRYEPEMVGCIVNACAVLHNIRCEGRLQEEIHANPINIDVDPQVLDRGDEDGFEARRQLIHRYFQ